MNEKNKRICTMYANEYHFELIALSYINGELKRNRDVVILTEKNIEETTKEILGKMNFSKDEMEKIVKIDVKEEYKKKLENIKKNIEKNIETTVFVKGNKEYIERMNKEIGKEKKVIKIIDSYDIEEVGLESNEILKNYDIVINMLGEKEIVNI